MIKSFHTARRLVGTALLAVLIGLPFLRIGAESAFRFDIPTLRLFFFGNGIWMQDFFIVLVALMFLTFLVLFLTTLLGRIWCGWLCPQTVLIDLSGSADNGRAKRPAARVPAFLAGGAMSVVVAASLVGYFVSPYDMPLLIRAGGQAATIMLGSWATTAVLLFLDIILLRRKFCATVCPYAKLQGVLFDDRTLMVAFDKRRADECRGCRACAIACPVGIDIREGLQASCIHCANCIDACADRMAARGKASLVGYVFGLPDGRGTGIRINILITGLLTAVSFVFFLYLSFSRAPFDASVHLQDPARPAILAADGETSAYAMSLRNTGSTDLDLMLSAAAASGPVSLSPDRVKLGQGPQLILLPLSLRISGPAAEQRRILITLTIRSLQPPAVVKKNMFVIAPGNR